MNKNVPTVFVTRHGARIAMSGAEAEELRSRSVVSRPDPGRAPAVYHPEGGRKLEEVGAELACQCHLRDSDKPSTIRHVVHSRNQTVGDQ